LQRHRNAALLLLDMLFRAATLNAWGLPELFAEDTSVRLREIGRRLPRLDLDAIAFQEVWTADAQATLVRAGRGSGLPHAWHGDSGVRGSGLLVLSRFPIASVRFEPFALRGVPNVGDYYGGKGLAEVVLETAAGPLALVDTHLHARYSSSVDHEYRSHRIGQIVQLASAAASLPSPLLVAGDFNLHEGGDEYPVLLGLTGLRDAAAELDARDPTVYRANPYRAYSTKPDRRIDLLLARSGVDTGVRLRCAERIFDDLFEHAGRRIAYSNHAGVLVELELARGAGAPLPGPQPFALAEAERLLAEGRDLARGHRRDGRLAAGLGLGTLVVASAGSRACRISRRRLLRGAMRFAGAGAVAPVLGFSYVSEVVAPDELRAFDAIGERLARLAAAAPKGGLRA
jgi:endonuclease/exonuclease/phosphatase family metal-dependent hydrolase